MQRAAVLALGLFLTVAPTAVSQADPVVRSGDSTVVPAIDRLTRVIYDSSGQWVFAFTRANLLGEPRAYGTELQAGRYAGKVSRIIAGGWTPEGKFGAEYYLADGELVFVYQGVEHFADHGAAGWRNFKGNPGWERRIYLRRGHAVYVETTGEDAPPVAVDRLRLAVTNLLGEIEKKARPSR